jgi:hypothetical protein
MTKFSVIIPTLWLSNRIILALNEFDKSESVDEIILINNNPKNEFDISKYDKIIHIRNDSNIFVNPSWNLGVSIAKNDNIIISNDDIVISNIDRLLLNNELLNYELVGLNHSEINKTDSVIFTNTKEFMPHGFGCFFYIKKHSYKIIPEQMKIWYGDVLLFKNVKNKALFSCNGIDMQFSTTVNSNRANIQHILDQDRKIFKSLNL